MAYLTRRQRRWQGTRGRHGEQPTRWRLRAHTAGRRRSRRRSLLVISPGHHVIMAPRDRRVALVTGGTRGLGHALADAFLHEGYDVAVCGRSEPQDVPTEGDRHALFVAA